jgi:hypothetical protein
VSLASAAGALFALSTLGGYLLSLRIGLFGFREVQTTAGIVEWLIEINHSNHWHVASVQVLGRRRPYIPKQVFGGVIATIPPEGGRT